MKIKIRAVILFVVILFAGMTLSTAVGVDSRQFQNDGAHYDKILMNLVRQSQQSHRGTFSVSSYVYGEAMGKQYVSVYKMINAFFSVREQKAVQNMAEQEKNDLTIIATYCPFFLDELKGLSSSTNISVDRLFALQCFLSSFFSAGQCTITGSTSPATRGNQTYLTQNWDVCVFSPLLPIIRFSTYFPHINNDENGYRYVFLGIPVLYEIPLMNEKGLGFTGAGLLLTHNKTRHIDEGDGIPIYFLELMTMKYCSNVSEVVSFWMGVPRSSDPHLRYPRFSDYDTTLWGDRDGNIVCIEETHSYFIAAYGTSTNITQAPVGILWHANHHQWLDPNMTGSSFPKDTTSYARSTRALALLEHYYGNITLRVCMSITRDQGGGTNPKRGDSSDICRKPDIRCPWTTGFSWIVVPKDLTVYWTHARPCLPFRGIFHAHNYTKEFGG